jgi:hypothetical protein
MVRPIVFLIADMFDGNEPTAPQARQFAFYGACSRVDASYDLRSVKAALRMAKDESQHALLNLRKQSVRYAESVHVASPIWVIYDPIWGGSIGSSKLTSSSPE